MRNAIEFSSRGQIAPEWLFDDHLRPFRQTCRSQVLDDSFEEQGWDRQIMSRMTGIAQFFFEGGECISIAIVPADITQKRKKLVERLLVVDASGMLKAVFHAFKQLLLSPILKSDTDHGNPESSSFCHGIQRWEDHLVSQVTRDPKEHERIRLDSFTVILIHLFTLSSQHARQIAFSGPRGAGRRNPFHRGTRNVRTAPR